MSSLNVFIDNKSDINLVKSMNKSGLVQVQRTVQGKHGVYTRMQWVRASEITPSDKLIKVSSYPMKQQEADERNSIFDRNQTVKVNSVKYRKGTVVQRIDDNGNKRYGIVKSVGIGYNKSKKFSDINELSSTSVQVEWSNGHHSSIDVSHPNSKLKVVSKKTAEKVSKRLLFHHIYFPNNNFDCEPLTEKEVMEMYLRDSKDTESFDSFVERNFFDCDGHNTTKARFLKGDTYTPERTKLHDSIIDQIVANASTAPEGSRPIAFLFGGGSASGKSSVVGVEVDNVVNQMGVQLASVDSDAIKDSIPEYKYFKTQNIDKGALRVHDESSYIADRAVDRLISEKKCFSFDGTMKNFTKYSNIIDKLKDAGYEVRIVSTDVPTPEAIRRSDERAKVSLRKVPHSIIIGSHGGFALTFPKLIDKVDSFCLYDNSQPYGEKPTLIINQDGIHNQELWDRFTKKGEDYKKFKELKESSKKIAHNSGGVKHEGQ